MFSIRYYSKNTQEWVDLYFVEELNARDCYEQLGKLPSVIKLSFIYPLTHPINQALDPGKTVYIEP